MMQPLKRMIAALMALVLICTAVPFPAFANGNEIVDDMTSAYKITRPIVDEETGKVTPIVDTYEFKYYTENENGETQEIVVSTQNIQDGETVYAPDSPEKAGFKFEGWRLDGTGDYFTAGAKSVGDEANTFTYIAAFQEIHYVFFLDNNGRVIETREGTSGAKISADATFPVAANEGITGWYTDVDLTQKVDSVTIDGANVTLYPKVETGYWITYNSDGGTYIAPAFVAPNTKTVAPAAPTRPGYTFKGWYNGNSEFEFGSTLGDNIALTAHWEGNSNTKYRVIHWQENANDAGYSFKESEEKTGTTGAATTAKAKSYDGFTAETIEQKTIAGDGSTIVNVYYKRNVYSVTFYNGRKELTQYRITAKYGANIGDKWPTYKGSSLWATSTASWNVTYQANIDTMPLGGAKFYYRESSGDENVVPYFVEALNQDGSEGTMASDGRYYVLHHNDTSKGTAGYGVTDEDRYPITGFTVNTKLSAKNGDRYGSAEFYYYRNSYEIKFINNSSVHTVTKQFEANISDVSYTPTRPEGIPAEYKFMGWYDNELCEGEKYVFSGKMPAKNITVYAKWAAPTFKGTIHVTMEGTDVPTTIDIPYGTTIDESTLPSISIDTDKYVWRGWATREGDNYTPFNFNTEIRSDITLYPYYTSTESFKVTYNANGGTGDVPEDKKDYADGSYADVQSASGLSYTNKVFLGWSTEQTGGTIYQPGDKIAVHDANITLYAIWGDVPEGTSLTYYPNYPAGSTGLGDTDPVVVQTINNAIVVLQGAGNFKCDGYEFQGWSLSPTGTVNYEANNRVLVDKEGVDQTGTNALYAVWKANKFDVTYTYTGTLPTGVPDLPAASKATVKSTVQVADKPSMPGYTFNGWYLDGTIVTSFTMPADDVVLTGSWTANTNTAYTVKHYQQNVDNNNYTLVLTEPKEGTTGEKTEAKAQTYTGFTAQSFDQKTIAADGSTVVEIYYNRNTYTVTYTDGVANEDVFKNQVNSGVRHGAVTPAFEGTPTRTGYYFAGWSPEVAPTVTDNVTYTAQWELLKEIIVVAKSDTQTYDGQSHSVSGFETLEFTVKGQTYTVSGLSASASGTNAGEYPVNVIGTAVVKDAGGNDVTAQFTVNKTPGQLKIEKRNVTLTSATDEKEYDENPLTNHDVKVTGDGFAKDEGVTFTVTGSQTLIGHSENKFTYRPNEGTNLANYDVERVFGTLTVTPADKQTVPVTKAIHLPDGKTELNFGDEATFVITVTNIYAEEKLMTVTELAGVSLSCDLTGASITDNVLTATLQPGQVATITAKCVVDETMIRNGYKNTVTVNLGEINGKAEAVLPVAPVNAELEVTKTNKVNNPDRIYTLGEKIEYTITVENTGNVTLTNLETSDVLTGIVGEKAWKEASIAPGQTMTYTTFYTITEDDISATTNSSVVKQGDNYTLTNTAVAVAEYIPTSAAPTLAAEDEQKEPDSQTVTDSDSVTNYVTHRDLDIEKIVLNPKKVYDFGDVIQYEITVTNNGTYTEPAGLTIVDQLNNATGNVTYGDDWNNGVYTLPQMAPGDQKTVYCSYTVPEADAGRVISNTAAVRSGTAIQDTDTTDGEKIMPLYTLTILYLDSDTGNPLVGNYTARLKAGTPFYVESPVIAGYTTKVLAVQSDVNGMPARDLAIPVLYTANAPEEEPEEEPKEPEINVVTPTDDGGYDLTPISELDTPLANTDLGDHTCCIMHFLLMLASLITLAFYTDSRKKHQARIHQLRESLKAEGKNDPSEKM